MALCHECTGRCLLQQQHTNPIPRPSRMCWRPRISSFLASKQFQLSRDSTVNPKPSLQWRDGSLQRLSDSKAECLRAFTSSMLPPDPPEKPLPGDCCGNGCTPCVWDTYYDEMREYQQKLKEWEAAEAANPGGAGSTQEAKAMDVNSEGLSSQMKQQLQLSDAPQPASDVGTSQGPGAVPSGEPMKD